MTQDNAILFVGHGSRDNEAVEEFQQLKDHFKAAYPDRMVAYGFLEFARPIIADGVNELIAQGATKITAHEAADAGMQVLTGKLRRGEKPT